MVFAIPMPAAPAFIAPLPFQGPEQLTRGKRRGFGVERGVGVRLRAMYLRNQGGPWG